MKELARTPEIRVNPGSHPGGQVTRALLAAVSDIALGLDETGMIREVRTGQADQPIADSPSWVGRDWIDTVSAESRPLIQEMLREAAVDGISRRRQVHHVSASGNEIPVAYIAIRLNPEDRQLVALGRDLSAVSTLQQGLVEAQQALERDYVRMRHLETRYRLLLQLSSEAVLLVDAATQKVVEANPAAAVLFDSPARKLVGRPFPFDLDPESEGAVSDLLATVRAHGGGDDLSVLTGPSARRATLAISLLRQDSQSHFLVRLLPDGPDGGNGAPGKRAARSARLLQALPDAFVAVDAEGRVHLSNRAFLDLVEMPTESQVRGQPLSRWIGRPGADFGVILSTLREHGVVRLFGTSLRGELGSASEIEVSGAALPDGGDGIYGLLIRDVARRIGLGPRGVRDLTRAVAQLTTLVGRISLKNLVRDTADLVERHFIEAALELTGDNRTSAAEVLGVSRQSLYVKLRRHNMGPEPDAQRVNARAPKGRTRRKKRV